MSSWLDRITRQTKLSDETLLNGNYPDLTITISLEYLLSRLVGVKLMMVYTTREERLRMLPSGTPEDLAPLLQIFVGFENQRPEVIAQICNASEGDAEELAKRLHLEEHQASGWRVWVARGNT